MVTLENKIRRILTDIPDTREDDMYLYAEYMAMENPITSGMDTRFVLKNYEVLGLKSYGSVSRSRRKIQSEDPALKCSKPRGKARREKEKEILDYVRKV